jgi:hypothetical protein
MNVDTILRALNRRKVAYLLIGGMNFMQRHKPVLTYDVDVWIEDTPENRRRTEKALAELKAEWGRDEDTWGPVARLQPDWMGSQYVFCLTSPHGAMDVFRSVKGLGDWDDSWTESLREKTAGGVPYRGISDRDMLKCQQALEAPDRKPERMRLLKAAVERQRRGHARS